MAMMELATAELAMWKGHARDLQVLSNALARMPCLNGIPSCLRACMGASIPEQSMPILRTSLIYLYYNLLIRLEWYKLIIDPPRSCVSKDDLKEVRGSGKRHFR